MSTATASVERLQRAPMAREASTSRISRKSHRWTCSWTGPVMRAQGPGQATSTKFTFAGRPHLATWPVDRKPSFPASCSAAKEIQPNLGAPRWRIYTKLKCSKKSLLGVVEGGGAGAVGGLSGAAPTSRTTAGHVYCVGLACIAHIARAPRQRCAILVFAWPRLRPGASGSALPCCVCQPSLMEPRTTRPRPSSSDLPPSNAPPRGSFISCVPTRRRPASPVAPPNSDCPSATGGA
mmetsp:Transcript_25207/g.58590  ORF Transcript_25207/g.58590 Transcript_25207/m.58590 type:complete len:236 (-) Transcript_25207:241-948(-)